MAGKPGAFSAMAHPAQGPPRQPQSVRGAIGFLQCPLALAHGRQRPVVAPGPGAAAARWRRRHFVAATAAAAQPPQLAAPTLL